jgi:hypothetical protein
LHQKEITIICSELENAITTIHTNIATVKEDIKRQNIIILGFQREVTAALQDFAVKLYSLTNSSSTQGSATSKAQPLGGSNIMMPNNMAPPCPANKMQAKMEKYLQWSSFIARLNLVLNNPTSGQQHKPKSILRQTLIKFFSIHPQINLFLSSESIHQSNHSCQNTRYYLSSQQISWNILIKSQYKMTNRFFLTMLLIQTPATQPRLQHHSFQNSHKQNYSHSLLFTQSYQEIPRYQLPRSLVFQIPQEFMERQLSSSLKQTPTGAKIVNIRKLQNLLHNSCEISTFQTS